MAPWLLECPFELVCNRFPFWNQVSKYSASGVRATQSWQVFTNRENPGFHMTCIPPHPWWKSLRKSWIHWDQQQISSTVLKSKVKGLVAQSYPALGNPLDYSLLGFSVHWILQARILEWVAIPFSRESSEPRDQTRVSHITGRFFTIWVTRIFLILINWLSAGNLDVFF